VHGSKRPPSGPVGGKRWQSAGPVKPPGRAGHCWCESIRGGRGTGLAGFTDVTDTRPLPGGRMAAAVQPIIRSMRVSGARYLYLGASGANLADRAAITVADYRPMMQTDRSISRCRLPMAQEHAPWKTLANRCACPPSAGRGPDARFCESLSSQPRAVGHHHPVWTSARVSFHGIEAEWLAPNGVG